MLAKWNENSLLRRSLQNLFTHTNLVHAISGATGSVVAMSLFYPLDTVRTRLQVDEVRQARHTHAVLVNIAREEGICSLYRGLFPVLVTLCCSNFVYFYTYNGLKNVLVGDSGKKGPLKDLLIAYVSGVVNVLLTNPLWVVSTRLKLQDVKFQTHVHTESKLPKYRGIYDCIAKIRRYEGFRALWNGTIASVILASNPSIQFMVYETIKRYFQRFFQTDELSGILYFIFGAIAKTVATIATYPLQVMQSRSRTSKEAKDLFQSLLQIIRVEGWLGLYKGMESKLLQTVLTAAMMFLCYEKIVKFITNILG